MKYTKEQINQIVNFHDATGKLVDVFDLHGILYLGNTKTVHVTEKGVLRNAQVWDITETHFKASEHSLPISIEDFEFCETDEEVQETFAGLLSKAVAENLV